MAATCHSLSSMYCRRASAASAARLRSVALASLSRRFLVAASNLRVTGSVMEEAPCAQCIQYCPSAPVGVLLLRIELLRRELAAVGGLALGAALHVEHAALLGIVGR